MYCNAQPIRKEATVVYGTIYHSTVGSKFYSRFGDLGSWKKGSTTGVVQK